MNINMDLPEKLEMDNLGMNKFMVPADRESKQYARTVLPKSL
jgi:hypothetical protein